MRIPAGPLYPDGLESTIFCCLHDEAAMFADFTQMSVRERELYEMLESEYPIYSFSFLVASNAGDTVLLYKTLAEESVLFAWHLKLFDLLGLHISRDIRFCATADLYMTAIKLQAASHRRIITACFSPLLSDYTSGADVEAASRMANSKIDLARSAASFGISLPRTFLFVAGDPSMVVANYAHQWNYGEPCVMKADGLGGGCNVAFVKNEEQLWDFCSRYPEDTSLLAQDYLSPDIYREYVIEGVVYESHSQIHNIREKIIIEGQWRGTIHRPAVCLSNSMSRTAYSCFERSRALGYCVPGAGLNCSIDCAVTGDKTFVFEVNARLTSGLPVALLIKKLGLEGCLVVSILDAVGVDNLSAYCQFVERNLYTARPDQAFGLIPIAMGVRSEGRIPVWLAVIGSIAAFSAGAVGLPPACLATGQKLATILAYRGLK